MGSDFRDSREIHFAPLQQEAAHKPAASMQGSLWSQLDILNSNLKPAKINCHWNEHERLFPHIRRRTSYYLLEWSLWEVRRINTMMVYKILCASKNRSRWIGLETVERPCTSNHLRILNAGTHCLISAKDLSHCGDDVLNTLMAKPGWWLPKAARNKWLSLQAALFCSPYLSWLEMRACKEVIPVAGLALQGNSYRCKELICKMKWLWAAGELGSRQKPKSQGSVILRDAFEETPSTATLLFSILVALLHEPPITMWLK